MEEPFSFDLSSASWRRSIQDEHAFVEALATRFERALPDKTTVVRERSLFVKPPRVKRIEISFDNTEFVLDFVPKHGIQTYVAKVVRGIRLKTDEVPFTEWLSSLSETVHAYAAAHEELRERLESFLMS